VKAVVGLGADPADYISAVVVIGCEYVRGIDEAEEYGHQMQKGLD